jgi:hypothetical protein
MSKRNVPNDQFTGSGLNGRSSAVGFLGADRLGTGTFQFLKAKIDRIVTWWQLRRILR